MKAKSLGSMNPDAYEAGIEIGDAVAGIEPEAIVLFSSIHYNIEEFYEGLMSGKLNRDVIVFGGTGDGFYETSATSNVGISALAISSEGKIRWAVSVKTDSNEQPDIAAEACARDVLAQLGGRADLALAMADISNDGVKLVAGLSRAMKNPFLGGLTGDDWQFKKGCIMVNGKTYTRAVAVLGMSGDFAFALNTASGWKPLGKIGVIDEVSGNVVHTIDGKRAFDFIEEQFGMPPAEATLGMIPMASYDSHNSQHFFLRTPSKLDIASGDVTYFGSLERGASVRVCNATVEDVLDGVNEAVTKIGALQFNPICAIVISCGARKWILRDRSREEVHRIFSALDREIPMIGLPSVGEIGPFRQENGSYSHSFFHNVSIVVLLLGGKK